MQSNPSSLTFSSSKFLFSRSKKPETNRSFSKTKSSDLNFPQQAYLRCYKLKILLCGIHCCNYDTYKLCCETANFIFLFKWHIGRKLPHLYMEKNRKWKTQTTPDPTTTKQNEKKKKKNLGTLKLKLNCVFFCNLQKYKEKDKHKQKYKKQSESSPSLVPSLTVTTEKVSWCIFFFYSSSILISYADSS